MIDQSGQLDRRIAIQSFTESTDDFGEVILSFTTLANVWAKVVEKSGNEGERREPNGRHAKSRIFHSLPLGH